MARVRQSKKCAGHKTNGDPCGGYAITGGTVCSAHGGRAPQVKAAAQVRVAEQRMAAQVARMNLDPVADPLTELQKLAGQAVGWKNLLAEKVDDLYEWRFTNERNDEQLRSEVALFERAMDRCASVLVAIAKLDIDDRLARVSEQQAAMVAAALSAVLGEMGLSHEQQREARTRVARHLRVAAG